MQTTEAAVQSTLVDNLYAAIGERGEDGKWTVRLYRHPLVVWIWLGAFVMALGGALAWSANQFRLPLTRRAPAAAPAHSS